LYDNSWQFLLLFDDTPALRLKSCPRLPPDGFLLRHSRKNGEEIREAIEGGYEQRLPSESESLTHWKYNSVTGKIRWCRENKERNAEEERQEGRSCELYYLLERAVKTTIRRTLQRKSAA
jgi:hypothetical protein